MFHMIGLGYVQISIHIGGPYHSNAKYRMICFMYHTHHTYHNSSYRILGISEFLMGTLVKYHTTCMSYDTIHNCMVVDLNE